MVDVVENEALEAAAGPRHRLHAIVRIGGIQLEGESIPKRVGRSHVAQRDGSEAESFCGMPHGTGHGIGLDVHEPPLLDRGGPELVVGDALTVEPGVYSKANGGVRVEDLVIVTETGCENLNQLSEGLQWR